MQTLFIGKQLIFLHEVDSTNTYAMNLLRNVNTAEGAIIYTDHQTKGKGQRGSVWNSEIGLNLIISCILKPHFLDVKNTFYLSKISALAAYDVMTELLFDSQYDIKIKWPNDILVNKKKVAGILIENNFSHIGLQHSIVGIGINVNQIDFQELQPIVSSLKIMAKKDFDRDEVLKNLCHKLEKWYLKLKTGKIEEIGSTYLNNLIGFKTQNSYVDLSNTTFDASIDSISNDGKLILKLANGTFRTFEVKEVKMLL